MLTQKSAIEKVQLFSKQLSESGVRLSRVFLFGSYAKNKQHKLSDIDVALVSDDFNGLGFYDIALFGKTIIKKQFHSIQPRTFNSKNFSPAKDPFVEEILKTGIEINLDALFINAIEKGMKSGKASKQAVKKFFEQQEKTVSRKRIAKHFRKHGVDF